MLHQFIGDRAFYKRVLRIAIPIIVQNGITTFVSLLDNIMVGQIGTNQMAGVSIINNLMFVFNLCMFGGCAGAGIFTAQFFGAGDHRGIRHTMRFKLMVCVVLTLVCIGVFALWGDTLIGWYLQGDGSPEVAAQTLMYARQYLLVTLFGLLPFALTSAYASTLRECGQTVVPMAAGIGAVLVNLVLNYILIFGHLGLPAMGVRGAALATVISRYVEAVVVVIWAHTHTARLPGMRGLYSSMSVPRALLKKLVIKGTPLLCNEALWSFGVAFLNQCYSMCSLDVVPAMNISSTIANLASVVFLALGNTVGILMGQMLGACAPKQEIRDNNRKLIAFSVFCGTVFAAVAAALSGAFPRLYNTTDEVRALSTQLILLIAAVKPFHAYQNAAYFTIRSGGRVGLTFLFDAGSTWLLTIPIAFTLSRFTDLGILPIFALCQCADMVKALASGLLIRTDLWIRNLTDNVKGETV